jgi:hypothetical protein
LMRSNKRNGLRILRSPSAQLEVARQAAPASL